MTVALDEGTRQNIAASLAGFHDEDYVPIRLSWLPVPENDHSYTTRIAGRMRHMELGYIDTVGPFAFGAWSGRWPKLPDGAWFPRRWARKFQEAFLTPPEGLRGVFLCPRTYTEPDYIHKTYQVPGACLKRLWAVCNDMHGAEFNTAGYYRSVLPGSLARTTTGDRFYCSEAVVAALQDSGALQHMVTEEDDWICRVNPGSCTPASVYAVLAPYGNTVVNPIHGIDTSFNAPSPTTFMPNSMDD